MKRLLPLLLLFATSLLHAGEHTLEHKGLMLGANLEKAQENWQQGPVVLLTHGTLAHNEMEIIATQQEMLAERGISSLAITLSLGMSNRKGMYDCTSPHNHKHTDALDEIGLWMDWLKKQGVGDVVLMGHSRGGNQTAWFAAERDDAVISRVILVAPATWHKDKNSKGYMNRYNKPLAPILAKAEAMVADDKGGEFIELVDFIYCPETSATADAFVSYYRQEPRMDTPSLLPNISKPVLLIAGSEDKVVKNLEDKMSALEGQENIQFESIDGADHYFLDLYAEELADLAEAFITGE